MTMPDAEYMVRLRKSNYSDVLNCVAAIDKLAEALREMHNHLPVHAPGHTKTWCAECDSARALLAHLGLDKP